MRKMIAGLVLALGVLGFVPSVASAHGGGGGCCCDDDGGYVQPSGHWELRTYCYRVWVQDCCCGHWETRYYQRYVWVWD